MNNISYCLSIKIYTISLKYVVHFACVLLFFSLLDLSLKRYEILYLLIFAPFWRFSQPQLTF